MTHLNCHFQRFCLNPNEFYHLLSFSLISTVYTTFCRRGKCSQRFIWLARHPMAKRALFAVLKSMKYTMRGRARDKLIQFLLNDLVVYSGTPPLAAGQHCFEIRTYRPTDTVTLCHSVTKAHKFVSFDGWVIYGIAWSVPRCIVRRRARRTMLLVLPFPHWSWRKRKSKKRQKGTKSLPQRRHVAVTWMITSFFPSSFLHFSIFLSLFLSFFLSLFLSFFLSFLLSFFLSFFY